MLDNIAAIEVCLAQQLLAGYGIPGSRFCSPVLPVFQHRLVLYPLVRSRLRDQPNNGYREGHFSIKHNII